MANFTEIEMGTDSELDWIESLACHLSAPTPQVSSQPASGDLQGDVSAPEQDISLTWSQREKELTKRLASAVIAEDYDAVQCLLLRSRDDPYTLQRMMDKLWRDLRPFGFQLTYFIERKESADVGCLLIDDDEGKRTVLWTTEHPPETNKHAEPETQECVERNSVKGTHEGSRHEATVQEVQRLLDGFNRALSAEKKVTAYSEMGNLNETLLDTGRRELVARGEDGNEVFKLHLSPDGCPCFFQAGALGPYTSTDRGNTWVSGDGDIQEFNVEVNSSGRLVQRKSDGSEIISFCPDGIIICEYPGTGHREVRTAAGFVVYEQPSEEGGKIITARDRLGRAAYSVRFDANGLPFFYCDRDGEWTTGDSGKTWVNAKGMVREECISIEENGNLLLTSSDASRCWTIKPDHTEIYRSSLSGLQRVTKADGSSIEERLRSGKDSEVTAYTKDRDALYTVRFDKHRKPCSYEDGSGLWTSTDGGSNWSGPAGQERQHKVFIDKHGNLVQISADLLRSWITSPDGTVLHRNREAGYQRETKSTGASLFEQPTANSERRVTAYDRNGRQVYVVTYDALDNLYKVECPSGTWHRSSNGSWRMKGAEIELRGAFFITKESNLNQQSQEETQIFTLDGDIITERPLEKLTIIAQPDGGTVHLRWTPEDEREVTGRSSDGKETYFVVFDKDGLANQTRDRHGTWKRVGENLWRRTVDEKPWFGSVELDARGNYVEVTAKKVRTLSPQGESIERRPAIHENVVKLPCQDLQDTGSAETTKLETEEDGTEIAGESEQPENPSSETLVASAHEQRPAVAELPSRLQVEQDEQGRLVSCTNSDGIKRSFLYDGNTVIRCKDTDAGGNEIRVCNFSSYKQVQIDPANGDLLIALDENTTCISKLNGCEVWLQKGQLDMFRRPDGACRWFHYQDNQLLGFDGYNSKRQSVRVKDLADKHKVTLDEDTGTVEFVGSDGTRAIYTLDGAQMEAQAVVC
jgi:hypothetical protein